VDRSFACILLPEQYRCIWLVTTSTYTGALAPLPEPGTQEAHAYTDGASVGSRGPGSYGAVLTWKGKTEEISGGEQVTTNLRMEVTAACVALETIDEGRVVSVYSDSSYLVNCMRRGWYKKWRENGLLNHRKERWRTGTCGRGSWKGHGATGRCDGEGEGALQEWRGAQERERPGRRARRGREEGGQW
jgi:RNase H